jgi:hypothetical protein
VDPHESVEARGQLDIAVENQSDKAGGHTVEISEGPKGYSHLPTVGGEVGQTLKKKIVDRGMAGGKTQRGTNLDAGLDIAHGSTACSSIDENEETSEGEDQCSVSERGRRQHAP